MTLGRPAAVAGLALVATVLAPSTTLAAKSDNDGAYYSRVDSLVQDLSTRGASKEAIDAALAEQFGWVLLTTETQTGVQATEAQLLASDYPPTASHVQFNVPSVYWNAPQLRYEARATWQWKNCTATRRCWEVSDYGNPGQGQDGFGMRFSKSVTRLSSSLNVWDQDGRGKGYSVPEVFTSSGVGYSEFDTQPFGDYSWDHGSLYMSFKLPTGSCVQGSPIFIDSKMGHTWSSSGVKSISVSLSGVSISFAPETHKWTGISNPNQWYPCG